jgi:hypothetical protein
MKNTKIQEKASPSTRWDEVMQIPHLKEIYYYFLIKRDSLMNFVKINDVS